MEFILTLLSLIVKCVIFSYFVGSSINNFKKNNYYLVGVDIFIAVYEITLLIKQLFAI